MVLGKVAEPEPNRRMRVNLDCAVELLTLAVLLLAVERNRDTLLRSRDHSADFHEQTLAGICRFWLLHTLCAQLSHQRCDNLI